MEEDEGGVVIHNEKEENEKPVQKLNFKALMNCKYCIYCIILNVIEQSCIN